MLATSGDTIHEGNETFHFILSNASANATISDATGVVTITDDENVPHVFISDASGGEFV